MRKLMVRCLVGKWEREREMEKQDNGTGMVSGWRVPAGSLCRRTGKGEGRLGAKRYRDKEASAKDTRNIREFIPHQLSQWFAEGHPKGPGRARMEKTESSPPSPQTCLS